MNKILKKILISIISIIIVVYISGVVYFSKFTYPRTFVNDTQKGMKKYNELYAIDKEDYNLKVKGRNNKILELPLEKVDFNREIVEKSDINKNNLLWPIEIFKIHNYTFKIKTTYNEEKVKSLIDNSIFFKNVTEPVNSELVKDKDKVYIKDGNIGDKIKKDKLYNVVKKALEDNKKEIVLTDEEYINPTVKNDDKNLLEKVEKANKIYSQKYKFDFEDRKFELSSEELYNMFEIKENELELNKDSVTKYVKELASKTNTYAKERKFNATGIGEVTVPPEYMVGE